MKSKPQKKNTEQSNTKPPEQIIDDRGGNDLLNPPVGTTEVFRFSSQRRIFDVIGDFYFYHIHWNLIDFKNWLRVKLFPKKYSRAHMYTSFQDTDWKCFEDVVPEALGRWFLKDYPNYLLGTPKAQKAFAEAQKWFVLRPDLVKLSETLGNVHIFEFSRNIHLPIWKLSRRIYDYIEKQDTVHLTTLIKYRHWVTD